LTGCNPLTLPSPPPMRERKKVRGLLYVKTNMRTLVARLSLAEDCEGYH
jgi:hypothetical protein